MKDQILVAILIVLLAMATVGCQNQPGNLQTFLIGPELRECVGVAPMMCMMVKKETDEDFLFFYDQIEGLDYEEGFTYEVIVQVDEVENPPADGSSLQYTLVEVVEKIPVE